ncbi:hypothetical protein CEXT_541721 [Caerostris extrusa]|uniref:Uncharacterized protein n=1 Tax=Caerostris extrusa TaxID=172846 RepID=A0AAV4R7X3_CAEEX|nr:hypothetical protein CEXT_541721 [Caerostris extrusa]
MSLGFPHLRKSFRSARVNARRADFTTRSLGGVRQLGMGLPTNRRTGDAPSRTRGWCPLVLLRGAPGGPRSGCVHNLMTLFSAGLLNRLAVGSMAFFFFLCCNNCVHLPLESYSTELKHSRNMMISPVVAERQKTHCLTGILAPTVSTGSSSNAKSRQNNKDGFQRCLVSVQAEMHLWPE